jgi:hypothetical protein
MPAVILAVASPGLMVVTPLPRRCEADASKSHGGIAGRVVRDWLDSHGFLELLPPIIGPVTDPGIRGAKHGSIDYYGREYKVMISAILHKQMLAPACGKI